MTKKDLSTLINTVFHDQKHGLRFFQKGERTKLKLREQDEKIEIWCFKREKWLRAKPEEVVRQLFLIWIRDTLGYSLARVGVEWAIQMGEDAEKERADIVIFTDGTGTEPYIVFELKKPGRSGTCARRLLWNVGQHCVFARPTQLAVICAAWFRV